MPCHSCQKSTSSPLNFLLNCISCPNSWHHRCHSPPVSDNELITIIKAFNAEKLPKLRWQCGLCIKAINQRNRSITTTAHDDDDDDEIIVLDGPPDVPRHNGTTNPGVNTSKSSHRQLESSSHPNHRSHTATSYMNTLHVQSLPRRTSFTKNKQIRIIDDPFLVPDPRPHTSNIITGLTNLREMTASGDDGALEYMTPPPIPVPTSKQVMEVPLVRSSNQTPLHPLPRDGHPVAHVSTMSTSFQPPNQLLIQWLNDRSTTAGVKPDLWARACLRRDQGATNRRSSRDEQTVSPPSRRKSKAYKLNEGSCTHSRATFFLSAKGWLRQKQASLLLE